jgi:ribonuclease-3
MRKKQLLELQNQIEYTFRDLSLLDTALTHTSFVKGDGKGSMHNERLEYLGDAVLELCVSEQLYLRYSNWSEGAMTRARAAIVCEQALDQAARTQFSLQDYLLLGHGEENTGRPRKAFHIVRCAGGFDWRNIPRRGLSAARAFVLRFAQDALERVEDNGPGKDHKTTLQEYVQKRHLGNVGYRLVSATGPDHKKEFRIRVSLNERLVGEGIGVPSRRLGSVPQNRHSSCCVKKRRGRTKNSNVHGGYS